MTIPLNCSLLMSIMRTEYKLSGKKKVILIMLKMENIPIIKIGKKDSEEFMPISINNCRGHSCRHC